MDRHIHDHDTGRSEGSATAAFAGGGRVSDPGAGGPDRQLPQTKPGVRGWIEHREGGVLTLSRYAKTRFDLSAATTFPPVGSRRRLAHQVRQDLWRALQGLRGFSPVVRITSAPGGLRLEAGGQVAARSFPRVWAEAGVAELLEDPRYRTRWLRHAGARHA